MQTGDIGYYQNTITRLRKDIHIPTHMLLLFLYLYLYLVTGGTQEGREVLGEDTEREEEEGEVVATDAILVPLLPEDITREGQTHPETGEGPLYPPAVEGGDPLTPLATGGGPLLTDVGQGVIDPVPLGTGGGVLLLIGGTDEGGDTVLRTTRLVGGVVLRMRVTVICLRYVKDRREIRRTH